MEQLLRQLIEQNERLISAVESVGKKVEDLQNSVRADLILADSSSTVHSIYEKLDEVVSALEIVGTQSVFSEILERLDDVKTAVEALDATVQAEAESLKDD